MKYSPQKKVRTERIALDIIPFVFIFFLTGILYSLISHFYRELEAAMVPTGDAFTYTMHWLKGVHTGHEHYWTSVFNHKVSSWYLLIYALIILFSPIIQLEPSSIAIVNFFAFSLATMALYRLNRCLITNRALALAVSLIYWLLPAHYGLPTNMLNPVSLFNLQLDTIFNNFFCVCVATTLVYALKPTSTLNASLAGLTIGLSIWSRGNALPYTLVGITIPLLYTLWTVIQTRDRECRKLMITNFVVLFLIAFICAYYYFNRYGSVILNYYSVHAKVLASNTTINWHNLIHNLREFPGFFFSASHSLSSTLLAHAIVLIALIGSFVFSKNTIIRLMTITGAFIFYCVLITMVFVFNKSEFLLLQPYVPLLVGVIINGMALVHMILHKTSPLIFEKKRQLF